MDTRGSRPAFFDNANHDIMMTALLEVMAQLWATRDYAAALEKLLVDKGVLSPGDVEALEWDTEELAANERRRDQFLKDAFRALNSEFMTVDKRNQQIDSFNEGDL